MPVHDRRTRNLVGLFWLLLAVVVVEICLFSVCFMWTLTPAKFQAQLPPKQLEQTLADSITRSDNMHRTVVASLALVLGALISQGTAQAPIPLRPPGFFYSTGSCDAPIQLESFLDLICPDSKAAWRTYQKVADYYGPDTVRFSALMFPLPYHRAAMAAAQGAFVADMLDSNKTYSWLNTAFDKQAALSDANISEQPDSYILKVLSEWASDVGYSKAQFMMHLSRSDPTQSLARVEFKYGATRGVFQTPQTFINGAVVSSEPRWTLSDWKQVIDPLLAKNKYFFRQH
ncbi:uncharacterized protein LOC585517 [Strongylocentrotus purpuratus]|uniref:Thioredoxin-like fold domain-containing protein n=1 Tax=Strongylocentrotus purpuratus TaxID=7668 RepID=A0A7M7GN52_STRPU|nr:uncharacterized protein LOC585517 [Strongylocentrotus purpuratus]